MSIQGPVEEGIPTIPLSIEGRRRTFIVDTGFNGEMILPLSLVEELGLKRTGFAFYITADGRRSRADVYRGLLNWFGEDLSVNILATPVSEHLIGTRLLAPCKLKIDFPEEKVEITKLV